MSVQIALERVKLLSLPNVRIFHGLIQDFNEKFDVGIALHACGDASDFALIQCLQSQSPFVVVPCCIGKLKGSSLHFPRSLRMKDLLSREDYIRLVSAADVSSTSLENSDDSLRRLCKSWVEYDRLLSAKDLEYSVRLMKLYPTSITPKNDILIGWPENLDGILCDAFHV